MKPISAVSPAIRVGPSLVTQQGQARPGVCTLRAGDRVEKSGCVYRVGKVSPRGVVTLNHTCGGFAMFSHACVCKVVA